MDAPLYVVLFFAHFLILRGAPFQEPLLIHCSEEPDHLIELSVVPHRVDLDGQIIFTTRLYSYKGTPSAPAPTIVMKAGDLCVIKLRNDLSVDSPFSTCDMHYNGFHCPDTTNLHTHGLHVSPSDDDINTTILPGEVHTYTYHLPSDHMMGTHWYHAHYHGSTSLQVMGGLAGALLVEKDDDYDLGDFAPLYEKALLLVLNHWKFDAGGDGTIFNFYSYPNLSLAYGAESIPPNFEIPMGNNNIYTINGLFQPTHVVQGGSLQIIRVVHAVALDWMELSSNCSTCTMTILARDGVFHPRPFLEVTSIAIPPGGRADLAILFPVSQIGQMVVLSAKKTGENEMLGGSQSVQDVLMTFSVEGEASVGDATFPTSTLAFPSYLSSLETATVSTTNITSIAFNALSMTTNGFIFPGLNADGPFLAEMCVNQVYELTIGGAGGGGSFHPYHQHVTHFQVVQAVGPNTVNRVGEWRDTIADVGSVIRFRPDRFPGYYTLHCHMLQHEDQGMMHLYRIYSCGEAQVPPVLSSVTPNFIQGGTGVVTIKGQNFLSQEEYVCDVGASVTFSTKRVDETTLTCEVFSSYKGHGLSRLGNSIKIRSQTGVESNHLSFFFTAPPQLERALILNKESNAPRLTLQGSNLSRASRSFCIFNTGHHTPINFGLHSITCALPSAILNSNAISSTVYVFIDGQSSNILTFELA